MPPRSSRTAAERTPTSRQGNLDYRSTTVLAYLNVAAKKTSKSKTPSKRTTKSAVNKSAFIREHGDKPPQEIMKLAKSKGIDLSIAMVYTILSEYRKKQGKASAPSKSKAFSAANKTSSKASGSVDAQFVRAIIELGAAKAEELFKATLAQVRAIGGK